MNLYNYIEVMKSKFMNFEFEFQKISNKTICSFKYFFLLNKITIETAKPSIPSIKFIAFIMATIKNIVINWAIILFIS